MSRDAAIDPVHELMVLVRSRHGLIAFDSADPPRVHEAAVSAASQLSIPVFFWTRTKGFRRKVAEFAPILGTADLVAALAHIESQRTPAIYAFEGVGEDLSDSTKAQALKDAVVGMRGIDAAILLVDGPGVLPPKMRSHAAVVTMPPPSKADYVSTINRVASQLEGRLKVRADMPQAEMDKLLAALRGFSLTETERIITRAIVEDGALTVGDVTTIVATKHASLKAEGLLEFCAVDVQLDDVAGLAALKAWLGTRRAVVTNPTGAAQAGLPFPKGMLLVGVPGCGKSMCAKAVAADWGLPLLKLDTSGIFDKYVGESEKRFLAALKVAENAAPVVLWIDEIEKAFSSGQDSDGGVTLRVLGTFLSWLQDRKSDVFVVATANDISKLPAESVRKGRFDEIFFVDLPDKGLREAIFRLHLARRRQPIEKFDLGALADRTDGFSGAEIEQAVVSACYAAFAVGRPLDMPGIMSEILRTLPLSATMDERISSMREWSRGRTVPAH